MSLEQILALFGAMGALAAGTITVVAFMMKTTNEQVSSLRREFNEKFEQVSSLRREINEKFAGCQKLCGNEMTHLAEDMKEIKKQIRDLWEEMFDTTIHGTPIKRRPPGG